MAVVGNFVNAKLYDDLSKEFPEIPEDLLRTVLQMHHNDKGKCHEVLSRESNKILYNLSNPTEQQSRGLTIDQTSRQRSQSGCSSGSDGSEFRGRSDSTGSRGSLTGGNTSGIGAPHGNHSGLHHSATTPAFSATHKTYVSPGPPTAPTSVTHLGHYMQPQGAQGFAYPPSIPCNVSGNCRLPNPYPSAASGQIPHTSSHVPSGHSGQPQIGNVQVAVQYPAAGTGATGGYGAQWIGSNVNSVLYPQPTPNVIDPINRTVTYPYQKATGWEYRNQGNVGTGNSNAEGPSPSRPIRFDTDFSQGGRTVAGTSPQYLPHSASLPYMSPDRPTHSPTTPTRSAVTPPGAGYGISPHSVNNYRGGSPGYNYLPGNTPPGPSTPATHVSSVYIPVIPVAAGLRTPPPVNPPSSVYIPVQPMSFPPGGYTQRPPVYPQQQPPPRKLVWKGDGQKSDWTDKDPMHEHFMPAPMLPTVTPSPTSSGGASLPPLDMSAGDGQDVMNRRHSDSDSAYSLALVLHQKARMDKLLKDLEESAHLRDSLRLEVELMEKRVLERRKARNHILSADDVQKVRDENRRLQIDIQLLTREIDMVNNGQIPLGWDNTSQDFHGNIPTGQHGRINTPAMAAGVDRPEETQAASRPARPPPPRNPPVYTRSPSEPQPPISMLSLPPSHPPPPPSICPAPRVEPEEEQNWNCSACTFANHPLLDKCECCEMPRVTVGYR